MEQIQSPFLGSKVPADKWEVIKKILKETGQRTLRYLLLHNLQLSSGDRGELIIWFLLFNMQQLFSLDSLLFAYNIWDCQAVSHPSTGQAQDSLVSKISRCIESTIISTVLGYAPQTT